MTHAPVFPEIDLKLRSRQAANSRKRIVLIQQKRFLSAGIPKLSFIRVRSKLYVWKRWNVNGNSMLGTALLERQQAYRITRFPSQSLKWTASIVGPWYINLMYIYIYNICIYLKTWLARMETWQKSWDLYLRDASYRNRPQHPDKNPIQ